MSDGAAKTGSGEATGGVVTAAVLVIGDEILSGRTKDKNIGTIAEHLTGLGIDLKEVRVVPDEEAEIIAARHEVIAARMIDSTRIALPTIAAAESRLAFLQNSMLRS